MHVKVLAYFCILGSHCESQISFVNLDKSIFFLTNTFAGTRGEWQAVCRWRQVETLLPVPVCQAPPVHSSSQLCSSLSLATPNDGLAASSCDKYNFILWQIHFHLVTNTIWSKLKIYPCALSSAILFNSSRSQVTCCWGSVSVSQLARLISFDCEAWQSVFICFASIGSSLYSH